MSRRIRLPRHCRTYRRRRAGRGTRSLGPWADKPSIKREAVSAYMPQNTCLERHAVCSSGSLARLASFLRPARPLSDRQSTYPCSDSYTTSIVIGNLDPVAGWERRQIAQEILQPAPRGRRLHAPTNGLHGHAAAMSRPASAKLASMAPVRVVRRVPASVNSTWRLVLTKRLAEALFQLGDSDRKGRLRYVAGRRRSGEVAGLQPERKYCSW